MRRFLLDFIVFLMALVFSDVISDTYFNSNFWARIIAGSIVALTVFGFIELIKHHRRKRELKSFPK